MSNDNISEKGKDYEGKPLCEATDLSGMLLVKDGEIFDWGNRKGDRIELYNRNEFLMTVNIKSCSLLKKKS